MFSFKILHFSTSSYSLLLEPKFDSSNWIRLVLVSLSAYIKYLRDFLTPFRSFDTFELEIFLVSLDDLDLLDKTLAFASTRISFTTTLVSSR
jgi:hypothetical protein